jgi:5-methylcytosine-specific restriction endonuclease McrA
MKNDCEKEFAAWLDKHGYSECTRVMKKWNRSRLENADRPKRKPLSPSQRLKLYAKQGGRCGRCGEPMPMGHLEDDHFDPNAGEGYNNFQNRRLLCSDCNKSKGANSVYAEAKELNITVLELLRRQANIHDEEEPA